jgi:hypothetical protein
MSTHVFPWTPTAYLIAATEGVAVVRPPTEARVTADTLTLTFTPDLTAGEVTTVTGIVADVVGFALSQSTPATLAAYKAIRPDIQNIRDLRQMGRNAFMALSAAERDRLLYDAQAATTTILLALLRE